MSATTGRIDRRTISFRASPPRLSGTATRAISQPASCRSSIWRIVASTSWVSVVHIDWTATGAPSPIAVPPTQTRLDFRRGRGEARSSGRLRSTLSGASITDKCRCAFRKSRLRDDHDPHPWQLQEVVVACVDGHALTKRGGGDERVERSGPYASPLRGGDHLRVCLRDLVVDRQRREPQLHVAQPCQSSCA